MSPRGPRALRWSVWLALATLPPLAAPIAFAGTAPGRDSTMLQKACEYGVTLAFSGEEARAESVFISLLSRSPGDPRALANLGNLHFLRGELDVALAFYEGAMRGDTTDAGIRLNRATTFMMLGQQELAESESREGVRMAGGPEAAASLLGIRSSEESPKASELSARIQLSWSTRKPNQRTSVSREEIRSLLGTGGASAEPAAAKVDPASGDKPKSGARAPGAERTAGTKASDQTSAAALLYWKR